MGQKRREVDSARATGHDALMDAEMPSPVIAKSRPAQPFGAFERMVAMRYIGATKKGRGVSFISVVAFSGIALSVATLIIVMSIMQGFRTTLLDQLLGVNGHVFVETYGGDFPDAQDVADRLMTVPGVNRATPILRVPAGATNGDQFVPVEVIGIEPDALRAIEDVAGPQHLRDGSFLGFGDGDAGLSQVAMASGVAARLGLLAGDPVTLFVAGGAETPFGRQPLTQKTYEVAVVFSIGNSNYDAIRLYMPLEAADRLTRRQGDMQVELRVNDPQRVGRVVPLVEAAVGDGGYYVQDWRDYNESYFNALEFERFMVRIILSLLVLVATLLIVSNMTTRVKDKTADIAVLRTMGATRGSILRIFLMSGLLIGVLGTLLGLVLGTLFVLNVVSIEAFISRLLDGNLFNPDIYILSQIPAELQWQEVLFVTVLTLTLTALASWLPARKAARLDPVEALRYE